MSDEYVRVEARVVHCTPKAVLLATNLVEAWVPRSCLHGADDIYLTQYGADFGDEPHEFNMREWVAKREGFI